jgi:hypothetical protein
MAIDWQDVVTTVGVTVGGGATLPGASAWLIKTALTHRLARDAEAFKARLKADADAEIERLKNSLQMTALEHQVRFFKLHEKRAEVIAELYRRLVEAKESARLSVLTGGPKDRSGALDKLVELKKLQIFIDKHRIYFPEEMCALLDKFSGVLRKTVIDVSVYAGVDSPSTAEMVAERNEALTRAYETFEEDVPEALRALEVAFRSILGEPLARPVDKK